MIEKENYEEIIDSIKESDSTFIETLKKLCIQYTRCDKCPLYNYTQGHHDPIKCIETHKDEYEKYSNIQKNLDRW